MTAEDGRRKTEEEVPEKPIMMRCSADTGLELVSEKPFGDTGLGLLLGLAAVLAGVAMIVRAGSFFFGG